MKNSDQNQNARREAQESSVQSFPMAIPADIIAPNHRKAFALAFKAAFTGSRLAFVAPVVRHSICRGFFAGARARFTGPQFHTNAHA